MNKVLRVYRYLNFLSVDIVAGAVCCSLFFSGLMQVAPHGPTTLALALAVWAIYTADHLLDAARIEGVPATGRHRFHRANFPILAGAVVAAIIVILTMCLFVLPGAVVRNGLIAGVMAALYLALSAHIGQYKEFFVSGIYSAGVIIPAASLVPVQSWPLAVMAVFALVVLLNLLTFSYYDYQSDKADGTRSFVTWAGPSVTRTAFYLLFGIVSVLCLYLGRETLVLWIVAAVQLILFAGERTFRSHGYFRLAGELSFCLPGLGYFL